MSSILQQRNWLRSLSNYFSDFINENKNKYAFEIIDITDCEKTGNKQAVLKLEGHYTKKIYIKDIISDNQIIKGLSPEAIRALTYLSVVEQLAPEYHIVGLELNSITEDYIVTIRSKNKKKISKQSATTICSNMELIKKLNSIDANRIGYIAGMKDTVYEYEALRGENE